MAPKSPTPIPKKQNKTTSKKAKKTKPNKSAGSQYEIPKLTIKSFWSALSWLIKTIYKIAPRDTILSLISNIVIYALPTLETYITAKFIDRLIYLLQSGITKITDLEITDPLFILVVTGAGLEIIRQGARLIDRKIRTRFRVIHETNLRIDLYYKNSCLDVVQLENSKIHNILKKGKDSLRRTYQTYRDIVNVISVIISFVISAVIAFSISPVIAVLLAILSIPTNIIFIRYTKKFWEFYNINTERTRKIWDIYFSIEPYQDSYEYKINRFNDYFYKESKKVGGKYTKEEMALHNEQYKFSAISDGVMSLNYIIVPIILATQILSNQITIGEFSFYEGAYYRFFRQLESIASDIVQIADNLAYLTCLKQALEITPVQKDGKKILDKKKPIEIEFKNVSFKYPNTEKYVLKDINLKIKAGQEIALVGENGAGKTTLIKLLLRFYDVDKGQLLINGIPIRNLNKKEYYKMVSALFQDFSKFKFLTVKENIHIGKESKPLEMTKAKEAAKQADAEDFIEELPMKYNQILSKNYTNGIALSSGQWQKLALARMFYRDAPLLIFDEPTASIDAEAEYRIFKRIYEFVEDKTVIIISHRFSTVKNADKIYVIADGTIVEEGSHEELLKQKGRYAKAFKMQAEGYNR